MNKSQPTPATTTRITFPPTSDAAATYIALTPESARLHAEKMKRYHLTCNEPQTDAHPVELHHVDPTNHDAYWADGHTSRTEVLNPDGNHIGGTWAPAHRRLAGIEDLLWHLTRATNWTQYAESIPWSAWLDAQNSTSSTEQTRTNTHGMMAGAHSTRTLTLTRHQILTPTGTADVWEVAQVIDVVTTRPFPGRPSAPIREHAVYADQAQALAAIDQADDGLPPLMSVSELAQHAGVPTRTFAQALRRERAKRMNAPTLQAEMPHSVDPGWAWWSAGSWGEDDGDTPATTRSWYNPRVTMAWWNARPGHGPGRGHSS